MPQFFIYIILATFCVYGYTTDLPIVENIITAPRQNDEREDFRLPNSTIPTNYVIELTPYFEDAPDGKQDFTFDGIAEIELRALQNTNSFSLHMSGLEIISHNLKTMDASYEYVFSNTELNPTTSIYTYTLTENLVALEEYRLTVHYVGTLRTEMNGFYRSYFMENGVKKWLATTQFQQSSARRVFPCYDEPRFKATFNIIINRLPNYIGTYSNTKLVGLSFQSDDQIRYRDVFKQTPPMSSYLIAIVVSEFPRRTNSDGSHGVFARPNAYQQTEYPQQHGIKSLEKLGEWTNISYYSVPGIEKLDHGAIPDFSAGAMENWGLMLYRETALLYDPLESNSMAQQRAATVVTHEQTHLWFGDLVTCSWWGWVWLNEGFARYFQYFATAMVETDWDLDLQFVVEQLQVVFEFDSLENAHPMTVDTKLMSDLSYVGDSTAYNKASSVLRMISHVMGEENFQTAIRTYLQQNYLSVVEPENLFNALQAESTDLDIVSMMTTWTTQAGYPLITVSVQENGLDLQISQKRFLLKEMPDHNDASIWDVALNYVTSASTNEDYLSTTRSLLLTGTQIVHSLNQPVNWIIFNKQQTGYYRVNYDLTNWQNIGNALKESNHANIHVLNRAQVIDDVMNIARAELIDYELAFSIFGYLQNEEHYIPWRAAFNTWTYIMRRFTGEQLERARNFIIRITQNIYNKLSYYELPNDTRLDKYNRLNLLTYLCKYGHADCISKSNDEYQKFRQNNLYRIPPNNRPAVYCTAMTNANQDEWNYLWDVYRNSNVAAEQDVILTALGCTKNSAILTGYFSKIITDDVRPQDKTTAFTATYSGYEENVEIILDYIIDNHQELNYNSGLSSILTGLAARFTTSEQISKLENFYEEQKENIFGDSTAIPIAIEDAKFNVAWSDRNIEKIYEVINSGVLIQSITLLIFIGVLINFILS